MSKPLAVSHNFRLYVSGADFLIEPWQFAMDLFSARLLENRPESPWQWQWMTPTRVWVTVECLTNTRISRPAWAVWCVTLDFSTTTLEQRFDASSIVALALVELPKSAPDVRVQAQDAFDDASADTLEEWALIALRYLDRESVGSIIEWALSA